MSFPPYNQPPRQNLSTGKKVGIGCGGAFVGLILLSTCAAIVSDPDTAKDNFKEGFDKGRGATATASATAGATTPPAVPAPTTPIATLAPSEIPSPIATHTIEAPAPKPEPTKAAPTTKAPTYKAPEAPSVYYKNCTAARAAGAAPVRRGDPGYGRHLDRDGDGVGCE